ncbi:MAG: hypothetical protein WCF86_11800, partial [Pseudolabrys sp.]
RAASTASAGASPSNTVAPAVQNECTPLSSMKGFHYAELLTCLQMTQDAKKLPTTMRSPV